MATIPTGRDISSMQGRVIDAFDSRSYYSGSDVRGEFEGIPVDDIAHISWKLIEPVKLHYGYGRRLRTRVSRGVRMVSGQLAMNFLDPLFMQDLLTRIRRGGSALDEIPIPTGDPQLQLIIAKIQSGTITVEQARQMLFNQGQTNLSSYLPGKQTNVGKPDRERLEAYRDALWGSTSPSPIAQQTDFVYDALYQDRVKAQGDADKALFRVDTFLENSNPGQGQAPRLSSKPGGFELKLIFGEPGGYGFSPKTDQAGRQVGAVRLLSGVEIMSEATEISETGEPIRSLYEFIAADVY